MAEEMMANVSRSGHPILRASSAFERGELRSKEGRKKSMHLNGSNENIELLLRTALSANQLKVHGSVADPCNDLSEGVRASGKPDEHENLEKVEIPTVLSKAENSTTAVQW